MTEDAVVDADGVLADFSDHLLKLVGSDLTIDDVTEWNIFKFMTDKQREHAFRLLRGPVFWSMQPPLAEGIELVRKLREAKLHVVVATSPWLECDQWESVRRLWLFRHFDVHERDYYPVVNKSRVPGALYIDDRYSHVEEWHAAYPDKVEILWDQPYNRDDPAPHRARSADDVLRLFREARP